MTDAAEGLKEAVDALLPWQRDIYEQYVAAGPGAQFIWVGGRRGGKFMIQKALKLRAEVEKENGQH